MKNRYILVSLAALALTGCSGFRPAALLPKAAAPPRPDVVIFKAEPSKVERGIATMLRWEVSGAESIIIDHGIGSVEGSGSLEIKPSEITAYNLTAVNRGGTMVSSVIINVAPPVVKPPACHPRRLLPPTAYRPMSPPTRCRS
jgi:hypothetical protein